MEIERVEVEDAPADIATLEGLNETVKPVAEDGTEPVSVRVPTSPMLVSEMTAVAELPATMLAGTTAPAEIVKSDVILNVIVVDAVSVPLVPVSVAV